MNIKNLTGLVLAIAFMGCGPQNGFQTKSPPSGSSGSGVPDTPNPNNSFSDAELWSQVQDELSGRMKGTTTSTLIAADSTQESLLLLFPFQPLLAIAGSFVSAEYPDIRVEKIRLETGEQALAVRIPFRYIFGNKSKMIPIDRLPNGDPLPAFPVGEIRGIAIRLGPSSSKFILNLYLGPQAVGAFIETPGFDLPSFFDWMDPIPIYNKARNMIIGYHKIVAEKGTFAGGYYVVARIPRETALKIQNLIKFN